jgi:hypothetical protein
MKMKYPLLTILLCSILLGCGKPQDSPQVASPKPKERFPVPEVLTNKQPTTAFITPSWSWPDTATQTVEEVGGIKPTWQRIDSAPPEVQSHLARYIGPVLSTQAVMQLIFEQTNTQGVVQSYQYLLVWCPWKSQDGLTFQFWRVGINPNEMDMRPGVNFCRLWAVCFDKEPEKKIGEQPR